MKRRQFLKDAAGLSIGLSTPLFGKKAGKPPSQSALIESLEGQWLMALDSKNIGRREGWFSHPIAGAKIAYVPSIIQEVFPGRHGLVWFWRESLARLNPHVNGRYVLQFETVDYLAEVWINGHSVGRPEGADAPFTFDITEAIKPGENNHLPVRVLNATNTPIDGIALQYIPHRNKRIPFLNGSFYDYGGIIGPFPLLMVPAVRIDDLILRPDWKTGKIRGRARAYNAIRRQVLGHFQFTVAGAGAVGKTVGIADPK